MRVAKYWHKEERTAQNVDGKWYRLISWGGSWQSAEEARDNSLQKIGRWLNKIQRNEQLGEYDYQMGEIREELIEELHDYDDTLIGAITRNRYGALVLNTTDVLIADVDVKTTGSVFGKLFGRKPQDKAYHVNQLRQLVAQNPSWSLRVYETHSGLRVFVTHQAFTPQSAEAQQILHMLGSDELYQKLCRYQQSFRARLTPKPWRVNAKRPPNNFPRQTSEQQWNFDQWLRFYQAQSSAYGVCRLIETLGSGRMTDNAQQLIKRHDAFVLNAMTNQLA